ncbi:hypothetical protein [Nocardiopsis tropica]|uniref:Uncharacterized protein n=1 Tax=Nocardiopsis tropica TaxID=109330 RepID=A0ABU7KR55_9ACTN|nr:hypothetical protein [Nocardiopsis umidischolae]MEE2051785.1 hypothetical protein [Nocardiopsis umidischolae]
MQITELFDTVAAQAAQVVERMNPGHSMTEAQYAERIARTGQAIINATLRQIAETDPAEADRLMRELHAAMQAEETGAP